MVPNIHESQSVMTLASASQQSFASADPWDAPYFGAPIYLKYQPQPAAEKHHLTAYETLHERLIAPNEAAPSPMRFDPWDAPYFGSAVYFDYHERLTMRETGATPDVGNAHAESAEHPEQQATIGASPAATALTREFVGTKRRNWFSWLFGQR